MPMVMRREETSSFDEEGSEVDCKFFGSVVGDFLGMLLKNFEEKGKKKKKGEIR